MKKLYILFFIYWCSINAQSMRLGDKNLIKENNKWFIVTSDDRKYAVNERSITVKLKENVPLEELEVINKSNNSAIERINELGYIDLLLSEDSKFDQIFNHYFNSGIFESVELNSWGETFSNDPGFTSQYHLYNTNNYPSIDASLEQIGWFEDGSTNPVIVAVIDCGVDFNNTDLNMWPTNGWDFIENDADPYPSDSSDHGTGVAGIFGAITNNNIKVAGVAGGDNLSYGAKIMSLRVGYRYLDSLWGWLITIDNNVVDDAILWAANHGAKIINMSFGCDQTSAINSAISNAYNQKGCVLVAATGNSSKSTISYPSSNSYVISVSGINKDWSNYGDYGTGLDLIAPSQNIYSTLNGDIPGFGHWGTGTSASAPQFAGVAALLWSHKPSLLHLDIKNIIKKTAVNTYAQYDQLHDGSGLLSAWYSLAELDSPDPGIPQISITSTPGTHPVVSWSAIAGAAQYKIYRAASFSDRYNYSVEGITAGTSWTDYDYYAVHPRDATSTFYYRVTAVSTGGEESVTSNEVSCGADVAWKRSAEEYNSEIEYFLSHNFPNPFNPATDIIYSIKEKVFVNLKVYNILGQEICTLVNEMQEAGTYHINFNASELPSGIYIYSIHAGRFTASRKTNLIK